MSQLGSAWKLIKPYFLSSEKLNAWLLFVANILCELSLVAGGVAMSYWSNGLYTALQKMDTTAFWIQIVWFLPYMTWILLSFMGGKLFGMLFQIRWRTWLTDSYLQTYFSKQAYYDLQLRHHGTDNPDQRISEDIWSFVNQTHSLFFMLLNSILTFFSFILVLWSMSGAISFEIGTYTIHINGYLVWVALIYSLLGTWIAIKIGRPLIKLDYEREKVEGNFRFALARIREYIEPIAFYKGEAQEKNYLSTLLNQVVSNYQAIIMRTLKYAAFSNVYNNSINIVPLAACAKRFFSGAIQLGDVMQIRAAFSNVQESFSFLIGAYPTIAAWLASTKRLTDFHEKLISVYESKLISHKHSYLKMNNISLTLPDGKILTHAFNLSIKPGERILIKGNSGLGKSMLLRLMAGLWPYAKGELFLPSRDDLAFTSQKPYMPLGMLKQSFSYPIAPHMINREKLEELMHRLDLSYLIDLLDAADDWGRRLSLGEQQRVAIIRIILQAPTWIILDEATSSMDESMQERVFQLIQELLPQSTLITVAHGQGLDQFHTRFIKFKKVDGYTLIEEGT